MHHLPVIVASGGVNAAGRSSFHHSYRRLVIDSLSASQAMKTWCSLAGLMNIKHNATLSATEIAHIKDHTLLRRIEPSFFDVDKVRVHLNATVAAKGLQLKVNPNQPLLESIPKDWQMRDSDTLEINLDADTPLMLPYDTVLPAKAAGQLPTGFDPGAYGSKQHPRGLEMSVYALSDALNALGIDWHSLCQLVPPEQISVYAGSAMAQLDDYGNGGMLRSRLLGERISARYCPFGLAEMPADFSNAYVLGAMGNTGGVTGACATLLYNMRAAMLDIRSGAAQIAIVGASEAPICSEVLASYSAMGALATTDALNKLDGTTGEPNWRNACRPFAENCGFTIAESAQYFILFSDTLALQTGAHIYGSPLDVCVNADGFKKSISSPGVGNYLTMARALAASRSLLGEQALQNRSYVLAHGTGTPQNRVTESDVLDKNAEWFGIKDWQVTAIKCFLGHSVAAAAGDQLTAALGVWQDGIIPAIATMKELAADVSAKNLNFSNKDTHVDSLEIDLAFLNAKGFGGNNATAAILSPQKTLSLLEKRHGKKSLHAWRDKSLKVEAAMQKYDSEAIAGKRSDHYRFGEAVYDGNSIKRNAEGLHFPDGQPAVNLNQPSPYTDMVDK